MYTLVLLRHGESEWNKANLFTGWHDVDLTEQGRDEARTAGELLAEEGVVPGIAHTSLQIRAIRTLELALETLDRKWIPVRRHWRLNERHYGDLQGKNKLEATHQWGEDQVFAWRRGYDTPPPPLATDDPRHPRHDPRYAAIAPDLLPASECLQDVVARMLPYWHDAIVPDLRTGATVVVSAHGNSLRALVKHLDRIADDDIADVNIPTGIPLLYRLDPADPCRPAEEPRYLGDPEVAKAKASAVARQATASVPDVPGPDAPGPADT